MKFTELAPGLFLWTDVCNVYVLRDGDAAILIDLGDGSVLDALGQIGVKQVEWVLFTHHHREQCQGAPRLAGAATSLAAPEAERAFFEQPHAYRKYRPSLGDPHTVLGTSYLRPPLEPIRIERGFKNMDTFLWRRHELWCLATPGNSVGSMSYLLKDDDCWIAFTGDLMHAGATLHTWFDSEWDYGFAKGIYALYNSASLVECVDARLLCPSHGPIIEEPDGQLREYMAKLKNLTPLFLRGWDVYTFAGGDQDNVSKPTSVPHLWHVSPHLYKFKGPDLWANFALLVADSGRALAFDCGIIDHTLLDDTLSMMQSRLQLKQIDAVIISHMHGDHCVDAPYLREKWGAKIWTHERVAPKLENPERFDYVAAVQAYGSNLDRLKCDGIFKDGESVEWEDYKLTFDWMPGQTEFHCCTHGVIDGKLMAFTGDNIFGNPADPKQNGHECVTARNSAILEEGYMYAAQYLQRLNPDMLIGAHGWVMPEPKEFIERYRQTAIKVRDAYQGLSSTDDYRLMFDPYWVRAEPYRLKAKPGDTVEVQVFIRNFRQRDQKHRVIVQTPPGITATPAILEGSLPAETTQSFPLKLSISSEAKPQVQLVAFDATLDGKRYGPWFDTIIDCG